MKRNKILFGLLALLLMLFVVHVVIHRAYTVTVTDEAEQIQPVLSTVRASSDYDTSVTFTDVETGETCTIGYLTHGLTETVRLSRGHWYTMESAGPLTLTPVRVRIPSADAP